MRCAPGERGRERERSQVCSVPYFLPDIHTCMSTSASISRMSLLASPLITADTPGMLEGMALRSFLRLSATAFSCRFSSWRVLRSDSLQSPPPFLAKPKKSRNQKKSGKKMREVRFAQNQKGEARQTERRTWCASRCRVIYAAKRYVENIDMLPESPSSKAHGTKKTHTRAGSKLRPDTFLRFGCARITATATLPSPHDAS